MKNTFFAIALTAFSLASLTQSIHGSEYHNLFATNGFARVHHVRELGFSGCMTEQGLVVTNVARNSMADRLGLRTNQIVIAVNGLRFRDVKELQKILLFAGPTLELSVCNEPRQEMFVLRSAN